ncbi:MAG: ATP-binding protein [Anaerolineae bacterium]|nr:ATP-binding protein [Anaerolineae bacterium]
MNVHPSTNPFRPGDPLAPFAGRQVELARMDHYLKEAAAEGALAFEGQHWLGKSALLLRFNSVFDDQFLGIYLPLRTIDLSSENQLIRAILDGTMRALAGRDITLTRVPEPPADIPMLRIWFVETWLPEIFHIIRPHRKLVLLMDDAHVWLDAEVGEGWPGATFDFFNDLLQQHPQLKILLTIPLEREGDLARLNPLVSPANVLRLTYLSADATGWLLRHPGIYAVTEDAVIAVHRATGGHPQLLQRFAHHIYQYHATHPDAMTTTPELVRTLLPGVYHASTEELASLWTDSTDTEQLVMLAVCRLRYEDPLKTITPEAISDWLVDGEYPLDHVTVNAALRSLEYREVISHRMGGIELTCGLMQTWLLESTRHAVPSGKRSGPRLRPAVLIAAVAAVVVIALLLINLSHTPQSAATTTARPAPTVTLANGTAETP